MNRCLKLNWKYSLKTDHPLFRRHLLTTKKEKRKRSLRLIIANRKQRRKIKIINLIKTSLKTINEMSHNRFHKIMFWMQKSTIRISKSKITPLVNLMIRKRIWRVIIISTVQICNLMSFSIQTLISLRLIIREGSKFLIILKREHLDMRPMDQIAMINLYL